MHLSVCRRPRVRNARDGSDLNAHVGAVPALQDPLVMGSGLPSSKAYLLQGVAQTRSFFSPGDKTQVGSRILFSAPWHLRLLTPVYIRRKRRCGSGPRASCGVDAEVPAPATRRRPRAARPSRRPALEDGAPGAHAAHCPLGEAPALSAGWLPARWDFLSAAKSGHLVNRFCLKQRLRFLVG